MTSITPQGPQHPSLRGLSEPHAPIQGGKDGKDYVVVPPAAQPVEEPVAFEATDASHGPTDAAAASEHIRAAFEAAKKAADSGPESNVSGHAADWSALPALEGAEGLSPKEVVEKYLGAEKAKDFDSLTPAQQHALVNEAHEVALAQNPNKLPPHSLDKNPLEPGVHIRDSKMILKRPADLIFYTMGKGALYGWSTGTEVMKQDILQQAITSLYQSNGARAMKFMEALHQMLMAILHNFKVC